MFTNGLPCAVCGRVSHQHHYKIRSGSQVAKRCFTLYIIEARVHACVGFFGCVSCLSDWQLHKAIIGWSQRCHKLSVPCEWAPNFESLHWFVFVFFSSLATDVPSKWMDRTWTNWNLAIWGYFLWRDKQYFRVLLAFLLLGCMQTHSSWKCI